MGAYLRLTPATRVILMQLYNASVSGTEIWGLRLAQLSGRPTGTVYPLLDRLEREGFVRSEWDSTPARPGPRRRLYELTPIGKEWIEHKLQM